MEADAKEAAASPARSDPGLPVSSFQAGLNKKMINVLQMPFRQNYSSTYLDVP